MSKQRVLLLSQDDVNDPRSWSCIPNNILKGLKAKYDEVITISPIHPEVIKKSSIRKKALSLGREKIHPSWLQYDPEVQKHVGKEISKYDDGNTILFSIFPDLAIEKPASMPWCFFGDATFSSLRNSYANIKNLTPETIRQGERTWKKAIQTTDAGVFTSDWARDSSLNDYEGDPKKMHVIPFGANFYPDIPALNWDDVIVSRLKDPCTHLLWIGSHWQRKQGEAVVRLTERIKNEGISVHLHMIGDAPINYCFPDYVTHYGKIFHDADKALMTSLFLKAKFFIMPSIAECFGIVFAESAAFALPAMGLPVDGVSNAVLDKKTGWLLNRNSFFDDAYKVILNFNSTDKHREYSEICKAARAYFLSDLNYCTFFERLDKVFSSLSK